MLNGMTVGIVGSLIWGPLLGWGSRILEQPLLREALKPIGSILGSYHISPSFLVPYCTHLALGRRVLSHLSAPRVSYLYSALACLLILYRQSPTDFPLNLDQRPDLGYKFRLVACIRLALFSPCIWLAQSGQTSGSGTLVLACDKRHTAPV